MLCKWVNDRVEMRMSADEPREDNYIAKIEVPLYCFSLEEYRIMNETNKNKI